MKKIFLKIVIGVVLACILFVCFLYTNNEIGVTSSKLETDIRSSQKIKDDWTVDGSVSSTMAAYISYPQDLSDHSFSVYVNRPGLSFGYFFRGGGNLSGVQRGIAEYTVEGYNERAFISMNQQQVTQLEIDDGNTIQVLDIDSNKPFAISLFSLKKKGVLKGKGQTTRLSLNPFLVILEKNNRFFQGRTKHYGSVYS